jgi:hypothetical protein
MNTLFKKIILHVILPLLIGFIIYSIARPDNWITQNILSIIFSNKESDNSSPTNWFAIIIVFNGADFCWSYSLTSALLVWKKLAAFKTAFFSVLIFIIILVQELVQYFFPSYFTFDIWDIVAAILAFLLSFALNRKYV